MTTTSTLHVISNDISIISKAHSVLRLIESLENGFLLPGNTLNPIRVP